MLQIIDIKIVFTTIYVQKLLEWTYKNLLSEIKITNIHRKVLNVGKLLL